MNQTNKIFVLEPRSGLCNQLNCIAIGLVIGLIYERKIYFHKFHTNLLHGQLINSINE